MQEGMSLAQGLHFVGLISGWSSWSGGTLGDALGWEPGWPMCSTARSDVLTDIFSVN